MLHLDIVQRPLAAASSRPTVNLAGHQIWLADGEAESKGPAPAAARPAADSGADSEFHLDLSALNRLPPQAIHGPGVTRHFGRR